MKIIIPIISACLLFACEPAKPEISEAEAMEVIQGFFDSFDVDIEDPPSMGDFVTDDFLIYENGEQMSKGEFADFVAEGVEELESTEWSFSDIRLRSEGNSAHVSMLNTGRFVVKGDSVRMELNLEWLESAYLIRKGDELKIQFYFSDRIKRELDTLR